MRSAFVYRYTFRNADYESIDSISRDFETRKPLPEGITVTEITMTNLHHDLGAVLVAGPYTASREQISLPHYEAHRRRTVSRATGDRPFNSLRSLHLEAVYFLPQSPSPVITLVTDQHYELKSPGYLRRRHSFRGQLHEQVALEVTFRGSTPSTMRRDLRDAIIQSLPFFQACEKHVEYQSDSALYVPPLPFVMPISQAKQYDERLQPRRRFNLQRRHSEEAG